MPASFILMDKAPINSYSSSSVANQLIKATLELIQTPHNSQFAKCLSELPIIKLFRLFRESRFCDGCCIDPLNEASNTSNYINRLAFDWLARFLDQNSEREEVVFICNQTNVTSDIMHSFQTYVAVPLPTPSHISAYNKNCPSATWFVAWRNDTTFSAEDVTSCKCVLAMFMQSFIDSKVKSTNFASEIAIEELIPGNIERPCVTVFKEAINMTPSTIILCSSDGAIIEANDYACASFGSAVRSISNIKGIGWLSSIIHPDDLQSLIQLWQNESQTFSSVKQSVRLVMKDGTFNHFNCSIQAVKGIYGEVANWVFKADLFMDHSKIEAAQKAINEKTRFLAEVSHEIRTPLACIIGTSTLLRQTSLRTDQEDLLNTIRTCSHQLFNLINNVLDFTKLEEHKLLLEKQPVFVERIIQEVIEIVSGDINRKDLDIIYEIDPNIPSTIICDELRLRQLLTNLVGNAVKFTDNRRSISIRAFLDNRMVNFEIEDQGPGIPSNITPSDLFDSFVQLDSSISRRFGGSGLGLAICKKIVNLMGGEIWYESQVNVGTKFCFSIAFESELKCTDGIILNQRNLDLFISYSEALAEYEKILMSQENRFIIIICVASQKLYDYIYNLLGKLNCRLIFKTLNEWLDEPVLLENKAVIISTNNDTLENHLTAIPSAFGILLSRNCTSSHAMSKEMGELSSQGRIMTVKRPIQQRQLIQTLQYLTTRVRPLLDQNSIEEEFNKQKELMASVYPLKILVVDDNQFNQMIIQRTLNKLGYDDVNVADDGQMAVKLAENNNYNLIFMDMEMPVMNGCESTLKIRAFHHYHHIPVHIVALTANAFSADKTRCLQSGMCDFLTKPVKIESIQKIIVNAWNIATNGLPCQCTIHCYGPIKFDQMGPLFAIEMSSDVYSIIQPMRLQSEIITSTQLIYKVTLEYFNRKVIERFSGNVGDIQMGHEMFDFVQILAESYKAEVGLLHEPTCTISGIEDIEKWYICYLENHPETKSIIVLQRAPNNLNDFQCLHITDIEYGTDDHPKATVIVRRRNQLFTIDEVVSLRAAGRILSGFCNRLYSSPIINLDSKLKNIAEKMFPTNWILKTVVYVSPGVNICCDNNGSIKMSSKDAIELFGNMVSESKDNSGLSWLGNIVHPDDLKSVVSQFKDVIQFENYHSLDTRLFNKNGAIKSFHLVLKPIIIKGSLLWWNIEVVDKSLLSSHSPIPRLIFAEMAHEIRTPLSCIIGTSSLLDFTHLSSEQKELIHTIKTCGQQLFNLINGILDITRMDYSKMLLEYNNVSLERVLYEATDMVYSEMVLKNLVIIVDVHESCHERVIVDEQRLRQIIGNLLANAVRYSKNHGSVIVTTQKVSEDYEERTTILKFSVEDNGVGIPEEEAANLFQAFSQTSLKPPGEQTKAGTGLGLAICKKLVNLMGGEIWFESKNEEGSKFFFTAKLSSDLSSYIQKPESFVTSKAALKSLKEYLNSMRGTQQINIIISIENEVQNKFINSKVSQLDLYLSVDSISLLTLENVKKFKKEHNILLLITDFYKDDDLLCIFHKEVPKLAIIQIGGNAERCFEKIKNHSIVRIRVPIRLSLFYRTIQEILLMQIYTQAIGFLPSEVQTTSSVSLSTILTPVPQYTPVEEPEHIAERFPMTILVVDDDHVSKMMFLKFLGKFGYESRVYNAADGSEAVDKIVQFHHMKSPVDLIFMDIQMPFVNGVEATCRIRKWCRENGAMQPHILALTAGALDQSGDVEYYNAGMCGVLTKPVQFNRLDITLREAFECVHNVRSCTCNR